MNLVAAFDGVDCTDVLVRRMLQQGAYAVPVEQQAAVKGQHKNELILRYSGLTRDELALGAAQLKARRSRPIGRWMQDKKEAPTALVRLKGLEPTRWKHENLNLACLPIPSQAQTESGGIGRRS